jgi:peptidoglycan hydrolase CwlO-like protein
LNDDNKKSQGQISKMKKNYEDLQKQIEALNGKIGRVQGQVDTLKEQFTNEDLERENEIAASLGDKLAECDRDVNGESTKGDRDRERGDRGGRAGAEPEKTDKLRSLQARKK